MYASNRGAGSAGSMAHLAGPSGRAPLRATQAPPAPIQHVRQSTAPTKPATTATEQQAAAAPKPKPGKLSAQHQSPPKIIRRPLSSTSLASSSAYAPLSRGALLGEGGFARVYAATEVESGKHKAVKVISKDQLKSSKTRGKLFAEIKLHQSMDHPYIVKFETCFEDPDNVYMQLELCEYGSLLDLLRKRKRYTEPEARLLLLQLVAACSYMHTSSVIHRDLKLGNLLLGTEPLPSTSSAPRQRTARQRPPRSKPSTKSGKLDPYRQVDGADYEDELSSDVEDFSEDEDDAESQETGLCLKVADFGLAALVRYKGERKKTICGTPNYIAPEILFDQANGHSFEVDVWSVGVILYTLLIGKPPFQTKDVKEIYKKIKENAYVFPPEPRISAEASDLISSILNKDPLQRPSLSEILLHPFFLSGPFPAYIPSSALTHPPDFSYLTQRQSERHFRDAKRRMGLDEDGRREREVVGQLARAASNLALIDEREEDVLAPKASAAPVQRPAARRTRTTSSSSSSEDEGPVPAKKASKAREAGRTVGVGVPLDPHRAAKEQRRVEREAQAAVSPASPIAELLRSARKPLYVSPRNSNSGGSKTGAEFEKVAQPQFGTVAGGAGGEEKKSLGSSTRAERRAERAAVPNRIKGEADVGRQKARIASGMVDENHQPAAAGSTAGRAATGSKATVPVRSSSSKAIVSLDSHADLGSPSSRRARALGGAKTAATAKSQPSRDLYESSYRTLDEALEAQSALALAALPRTAEPKAPKVFISSWVDYTHKYGTAYALTDGSSGIHFNDSTTAVLAPNLNHFDYISNLKGSVYQRRNYTLQPASFPSELSRKTYLLEYFQNYMAKTLQRDVAWAFVDLDRTKHLDYLVKTYRMKKAIVFKLSNDVIQINFWDHQKLLLTQNAGVITFIESDLSMRTYSIGALFLEASALGLFSASQESDVADAKTEQRRDSVAFMLSKLEYARDVLKNLAARTAKTTAQPTAA